MGGKCDHGRRRQRTATGFLTGFTLIEIIIAVAIFTILVGLLGAVGNSFYQGYVLYAERTTVLAALQKARNLAMANIGEASHGVFFDASRYVIFEGVSYASRNVLYDQEVPKAPGIAASGASEIVFAPLSGDVLTVGIITFESGSDTVTIAINGEGRISH